MVIKEFKQLNLKAKIGIILNLTPVYPRSDNLFDLEAAKWADLFYIRSFLDPSVKGSFPTELVDLLKKYNVLPDFNQDDLVVISQNTIQILGVNYYSPKRVKARLNSVNYASPFLPEWFFEPYVMPGRKFNS